MTIGNILYTLLISPLRLVFEVVFAYANSVLNDPGLSIIVLSLAINLLVLPLYRRSDAMQEEERDIQAKLKDGVAHIRKAFKGDERMMMLQTYYRQNNYKPTYVLRGAMSLFLEIPFFIAAYSFLSNLTILTGVALGPIGDLARPDGLLFVFGLQVNLLPIIMTAVNCVSTIIFTKGYPLKTKIQLYAMALFFLIFLYNSPSGLVFYWTLNNVFSLVKTVFYKLKNPRRVLAILAAVCGAALAAAGALYLTGIKLVFFVVVGVALVCPLVYGIVKNSGKLAFAARQTEQTPNAKLFWTAAAFLAVLSGILIPSAVIKASPLEFISRTTYYNPLWYIVSAACFAFGLFVIWFGVFYWLASPKGKVWFERVFFVLCGVAVVDYMFFGRDLGNLTSTLKFENGLSFSTSELLLNAAVVLIVAAAAYLLSRKWSRASASAVLICTLALTGMSAANIVSAGGSIREYQNNSATLQNDELEISLSRNGQNVIVLMLDRAAAHLVPYIINERPELAEQFSGFTFYDNTVSFGMCTNIATPALFGGYEYMPVELNKRDTESLESKQNEALKVMPVSFLNAGYDVTVYDPPYAGYRWIPDLTIYDDYPEIKTGITIGSFNGANVAMATVERKTLNRNFFCYSILKLAPLAVQGSLYEDGDYRHQTDRSEVINAMDRDFQSYPTASSQTVDSRYKAHGVYTSFLDSYTVLTHLADITRVSDSDSNTFLMMSNDTTHEQSLLQEPDYVPAYMVDNTAYENEERFTLNGQTMNMDDDQSIMHYHVNMAALLRLGEWFDYLRELGVYDNTRIILVADHNDLRIGAMDKLYVSLANSEDTLNVTGYYPLLMVKDFNATGPMVTDSTFMTNADVPTLAMEGVIDEPTNPFTGNPIDSSAKQTQTLYVFSSREFDLAVNNGNTLLPDNWYSVRECIWGDGNWAYEGYGVLPETLGD